MWLRVRSFVALWLQGGNQHVVAVCNYRCRRTAGCQDLAFFVFTLGAIFVACIASIVFDIVLVDFEVFRHQRRKYPLYRTMDQRDLAATRRSSELRASRQWIQRAGSPRHADSLAATVKSAPSTAQRLSDEDRSPSTSWQRPNFQQEIGEDNADDSTDSYNVGQRLSMSSLQVEDSVLESVASQPSQSHQQLFSPGSLRTGSLTNRWSTQPGHSDQVAMAEARPHEDPEGLQEGGSQYLLPSESQFLPTSTTGSAHSVTADTDRSTHNRWNASFSHRSDAAVSLTEVTTSGIHDVDDMEITGLMSQLINSAHISSTVTSPPPFTITEERDYSPNQRVQAGGAENADGGVQRRAEQRDTDASEEDKIRKAMQIVDALMNSTQKLTLDLEAGSRARMRHNTKLIAVDNSPHYSSVREDTASVIAKAEWERVQQLEERLLQESQSFARSNQKLV